MSGAKRFLSADRVRYLSLPQYEGLGIKEILQQAQGAAVCADYLPAQEEFRKLPRQWLINLAYTLIGPPFAVWSRGVIEARNKRLVDEQQLGIAMDPDILQYFTQSTAVSSNCSPSRPPSWLLAAGD